MIALVLLVWSLAGMAAGVLLNSLADSLPPDDAGHRHLPGRPRCRSCGRAYRARWWLAAVAAAVRTGRCEHCEAPRPARHALVELTSALALSGAWLWAAGSPTLFVPAAVLAELSILVAVIDIEHRLILHSVILPAALVFAALALASPRPGLGPALLGGLAGYGLVYAIYLLGRGYEAWMHWRGRTPPEGGAFGGGDVNLAGVLGLALGWPAIGPALLITIFAGGFFSGAYLLVQALRRRPPAAALPYGPFLLLGALAMYFGSP